MKEPDAPKRPICSSCAAMLGDRGFRIRFPRDAMLHMDKCSICERRLPVHDGWVLGAGKRRRKRAPAR